ncbi:APC family permease [Alicyclobacillus cycloheptanicus]|uniref:Amino acid transporter n=1 Tax=Alicyclobacillus cycloheptanicus TaxID=1457 RepID=A0ABT9XF17_9BACL|nr:APC family permease [Alicyclobacillus cycloheptanicus]MDQ0188893.1 amino acid transporter [Alicyclobacillus cycloheptanicus]WDM01752.1 APC family permease [Alicyclobacillus cycloheptanicus]
MQSSGGFKRRLNLLDLTLLGLGSIIGSGWLFAANEASIFAGSNAWISWLIGGVAFILIGLVYAELGSAMPRAGGFVRYPQYTHGTLVGYLIGFTAMLAYSSVAGIEVEAVRGYAATWLPALGTKAQGPTFWGFVVEIALLVFFFLLNYWSVNVFGKFNTVITAIKFLVPLLTIVVLFTHFHGSNLAVGGAKPGGTAGVFQAVSMSGIAFAYLGFRQAVDFGAESKRPQRDIPLAIIFAILLATLLYLLLQFAYLGAVPHGQLLKAGWAGLTFTQAPYAELAQSLGALWLMNVIFVDAVISPSGTGNIYLSGTTRVLFAWARTGLFYTWFRKVDARTGIPRGALWLSLLLSIAWILPAHQSFWSGLVGNVTSATVLTYMVGPISLASLRKTAPDMERPFRLGAISIVSPLAFIAASLIIYWSGWTTNFEIIGMVLASLVLYFAFIDREGTRNRLKSDWKTGAWLVVYYVFMLVVSRLGNYQLPTGAKPVLPNGVDDLIVAVGALIIYYWGVNSAMKKPEIDTDDEEVLAVNAADV